MIERLKPFSGHIARADAQGTHVSRSSLLNVRPALGATVSSANRARDQTGDYIHAEARKQEVAESGRRAHESENPVPTSASRIGSTSFGFEPG